MKKFICVKTDFYGVHQYKDAPEEVAFLRNIHRHKFFITAEIEVFHDDRELEFIMVKNAVNNFIAEMVDTMSVLSSCEMMCGNIIKFLEQTYGNNRLIKVSCFEDDENGAVVYNDLYERSVYK